MNESCVCHKNKDHSYNSRQHFPAHLQNPKTLFPCCCLEWRAGVVALFIHESTAYLDRRGRRRRMGRRMTTARLTRHICKISCKRACTFFFSSCSRACSGLHGGLNTS